MKFLQKLIALIIGVVFFAALIIGIGMIFAIKNINVTLVTYADEEAYTESYVGVKSSLKKLKGESLLFVSQDDVVDAVGNSNYKVASFEKKFPCTVNIVLKERLETFAVSASGLYWMYDNDGRLLRSCLENNNINDRSPNVELLKISGDDVTYIASIAAVFKGNFGSLRSAITSIEVDSHPEIEGYKDRLYFNFRCGLKIRLDEYKEETEAKIKAAYDKFKDLNDREKLGGVIRSYRLGGAEGIINTDYSYKN